MTQNLNELVRGGTFCFDSAGLAEGTNDHTIKVAGTDPAGVNYAINGIMYYKANADNIAPTVCSEQTLAYTCLYLVCVNSTGTVSVVQGTEVSNAALTAGTAVLHWPTPTASTCCIGAIKVACGTTAFTVGVDDITDDVGTGTITFYNLFAVPAAPMTS